MLSIVIPVYNEEGAVAETLRQLRETLAAQPIEYELICVNDCSSDGSGEILRRTPGLVLVEHARNRGYGASLKDGIRVAKGEYVLILDADGTYPIDEVPKLLAEYRAYDMVVGHRQSVVDPPLRYLAKRVLFLIASILVNARIPDLNSGMRIFRRDLALAYFFLLPSGFSFTSTITVAALANDYAVKYVPISYHKRVGKSSIQPIDFLNFVSLVFRLMLYFSPLKFFLLPGLLLTFAGLGVLVYQVVTRLNIADLPILLILTGTQIVFLGLLADLIARSRTSLQTTAPTVPRHILTGEPTAPEAGGEREAQGASADG